LIKDGKWKERFKDTKIWWEASATFTEINSQSEFYNPKFKIK